MSSCQGGCVVNPSVADVRRYQDGIRLWGYWIKLITWVMHLLKLNPSIELFLYYFLLFNSNQKKSVDAGYFRNTLARFCPAFLCTVLDDMPGKLKDINLIKNNNNMEERSDSLIYARSWVLFFSPHGYQNDLILSRLAFDVH